MSKKQKVKRLFLCFMILCLGACSTTKPTTSKENFITQKASEEGRTQITVLVKYAFSINGFEEAIEERFPDIDIVQVGNYTANTTLAKEYETRLKHDDLTDIVMTWPLDVGEEYWKDRLLDLSGMSFSANYKPSMLDTITTEDGSLYYLPGPADIRGIIYNKTLFKEKGWDVPTNYDEFITLCKTIEESGMRAFELSFGNEEVLDTGFVAFNFGDAFSKPTDTNWLYEYKENQVGNFNDHFSTALTTFQELIDAGVYKASDLDLYYQDTQSDIFTRDTAMIEESLSILNLGKEKSNKDKDEFALMPFFNKNSNDWVRIYMTCYIGLNKHLLEDQEKYDKTMKIMEFISTPEGQEAMSMDSGAMYSSLLDANVPNIKEIELLLPALNEGRYAIFPSFDKAQTGLREGLSGMLKKERTASDVAKMADASNLETKNIEKAVVLGNASEDFSLIDTGSYVCDAMKERADTQIALFLDNGMDGRYNGKGISAKFYKGEIVEDDISRVFPDLKHGERGALWKIKMSGEDLRTTLEHAISVDGQEGWFYYFSGLKMTYDITANPGERLTSIQLADGAALQEDELYTIAVMEDSVPEEYIVEKEDTGLLIQDVLKEKIVSDGEISPAKDGRFQVE